MTLIPIACDNCGAKYRLPETFSGTQSKCQECGSVIDVQRQRDGAAAAVPEHAARPAAAARPATAARLAVDRSKEQPAAPRRRAGSERTGTGSNRGRSRGEPRERKQRGKPLLWSGLGLLAIVVVVVLLLRG